MSIVKGYYDTKTDTFLGIMTSNDSRTNIAVTPRYVEGICFGEYNTETEEFTPLTNPMIIPKGQVMTTDIDHDAFLKGKYKEIVSGIEEDKGSDIVSKGFKLNNTMSSKSRNLAVDLNNLF